MEVLFEKAQLDDQNLTQKQKDALLKFVQHEDEKTPKNLKTANVLTRKEDRVAGRMDVFLFTRIKDLNKNDVIVKTIRKILRDRWFRVTFMLRSVKQMIIDYYSFYSQYKDDQELLSYDENLETYESNLSSFIRRITIKYPKSVTGNPLNYEKLLLRYYCVFIFDISVNMIVRNSLLFTIDKKINLDVDQPVEKLSFNQFPNILMGLSFDKPVLDMCLKCDRIGYLIDCWESCKAFNKNIVKAEEFSKKFDLPGELEILSNRLEEHPVMKKYKQQ